jgi:flagellar protein FliT
MEFEMSQQLIDYYKAIEDSSARMLDAAKTQDWDQVVRFEGVCAVLIEQLRVCALGEELAPAAKGEKFRIMQRILQNDAEIRYLTEPMLDGMNSPATAQPAYLH